MLNYKIFKKFLIPISISSFILSLCFFILGIYFVFYKAPDDYLQLNLVKILYLHVPSAWLSICFYLLLSIASILFLALKNPLYDILVKSFAYVSLYFTISTLITGAIWGKPAWGTWWIWDARLTSMLILLCFEIIYFLIRNSFQNELRGAKISSVFAIFGLLDLPIIKFSVNLWATLHQKNSVFTFSGPKIHESMLYPLFIMFFALFFLAIFLSSINIYAEIVGTRKNNGKF
jgi:heme exporter protein C